MDPGRHKKIIIQSAFIVVFAIFLTRLFYLQVVDETYKELAKDRIYRKELIYPARGLIYDRNSELIVYNEAIYNLMVIPIQAKKIDTAKFCQLLSIDKKTFDERMAKAKKHSWRSPSIFVKNISAREFGTLEESLYQFKGFYPETRTVRQYPFSNTAHLLGYVGEVNSEEIEESERYYRSGDYIGKSGIEKQYEKDLRGTKGKRFLIVDVFSNAVGSLSGGEFDTIAIIGKPLRTTLDIKLQDYGEKLMANKKGAVVAIDPSSGEILALFGSPTYDPNLLIGRQRSKNYIDLTENPNDLLNNRALTGYYPPGSIFKPVMALLGLQEKTLTPLRSYPCNSGYRLGSLHVGYHAHVAARSVKIAVQNSCNAYFCSVFKAFIENEAYRNPAESLAKWRKYLLNFSIGEKTGIDLPGEYTGGIPTVDYYDRLYGANRWKASTIISLSIGQGEIIMTPLQMANMIAVFANRGFYYTPHIVKSIDGIEVSKGDKHLAGIDRKHFDLVVDGLEDVVKKGTGRNAAIDSIVVCGKTGTAENPHGADHSVFVAFAPKENPKIAIAVMVENSGFGSTWAAPIVGLMIEKYLKGKISKSKERVEKRMLEGNLLSEPEE
jgi:penicillin-binding protein 2